MYILVLVILLFIGVCLGISLPHKLRWVGLLVSLMILAFLYVSAMFQGYIGYLDNTPEWLTNFCILVGGFMGVSLGSLFQITKGFVRVALCLAVLGLSGLYISQIERISTGYHAEKMQAST